MTAFRAAHPIVIEWDLIQVTGDLKAALVMTMFCHYDPGTGQWLKVPADVIYAQTGLTRHEVDRAIRLLKGKGFLLVSRKGRPATNHFPGLLCGDRSGDCGPRRRVGKQPHRARSNGRD